MANLLQKRLASYGNNLSDFHTILSLWGLLVGKRLIKLADAGAKSQYTNSLPILFFKPCTRQNGFPFTYKVRRCIFSGYFMNRSSTRNDLTAGFRHPTFLISKSA